MGRVMVNGRERHLTQEKPAARGHTWTNRKFQFDVYGPKAINEVTMDLDQIQRHFGTSKATTFRIALKLVAKAIKDGRLKL